MGNIPHKGGMFSNRKTQKARKTIITHEETEFKFFVLLKKGCHKVWDISLLQTATLTNRRWMSNS